MSGNTKGRMVRRTAAVAGGMLALGGGLATAFVGPGVDGDSGPLPNHDGPDLVSATITEVDFTDGTNELATFCFDTNVRNPTAEDFLISSYDQKRRWRAIEANAGVAPDPQKCVLAEFPSGSNLNEGTVATINDEAVAENGNFGQRSPIGSVPLGGSPVDARFGETTGPDLVSVSVEGFGPTQQRADFCFDERLDEDGPVDASRFTLMSQGGLPMSAVSASVNGDGVCVRALFPDPSGGGNDPNEFNVRSAVRGVAGYGAVTDEDDGLDGANPGGTAAGTPSAAGTLPVQGSNVNTNGRTSRPDLIAAEQLNEDQFRVRFDQDVDNYDPTGVYLVTDDNELIVASSFRRDGAQDTAIASFDDLEGLVGVDRQGRELGEIVSIIVDFTGVFDSEVEPQDKLPSSGGVLGLYTPREEPGLTNAPDLLWASFADSTNTVLARFDEDIDDDGFQLGDIRLLRESGVQEPALRAASVSRDRARFEYTVAGDAGVALLVGRRAVRDDNPTSAGANGVNTREWSVGQGVGVQNPDPGPPCAPGAECDPITVPGPTVTVPGPTVTGPGTVQQVPVPFPVTGAGDGGGVGGAGGRASKPSQSLKTGLSMRKRLTRRTIGGKVTSQVPGCRTNRQVRVLVDGVHKRITRSGGDLATLANGQWTVQAPRKASRITVSIPSVTKTMTRLVEGVKVRRSFTCGSYKQTFRYDGGKKAWVAKKA